MAACGLLEHGSIETPRHKRGMRALQWASPSAGGPSPGRPVPPPTPAPPWPVKYAGWRHTVDRAVWRPVPGGAAPDPPPSIAGPIPTRASIRSRAVMRPVGKRPARQRPHHDGTRQREGVAQPQGLRAITMPPYKSCGCTRPCVQQAKHRHPRLRGKTSRARDERPTKLHESDPEKRTKPASPVPGAAAWREVALPPATPAPAPARAAGAPSGSDRDVPDRAIRRASSSAAATARCHLSLPGPFV